MPKEKTLSSFTKSKLALIYLPRIICNHIIGHNHHVGHRITIGFMIMMLGVFIAKTASEYYVLTIIYDACGYALHAIGAVPIIEWLLKFKE